jgi:GGDEF domain-containing protein
MFQPWRKLLYDFDIFQHVHTPDAFNFVFGDIIMIWFLERILANVPNQSNFLQFGRQSQLVVLTETSVKMLNQLGCVNDHI